MIVASTLRSSPEWVHGFTERLDANGERLDLGSRAGDADWARVARDLGVPNMQTARVSQVHGASVVWADGPGMVGEADAIITDRPGFLISVRTADCVPILVAGKGLVAAIHAGWRGLAAGVIPATIDLMGASEGLRAVVGPSICCACYEVGEEVVDGISAWVDSAVFVERKGPRPHVDGGAAAVAQLRQAGVESVEHLALCTWCDGRFWSHRQEGVKAGRQAAVIGLRC